MTFLSPVRVIEPGSSFCGAIDPPPEVGYPRCNVATWGLSIVTEATRRRQIELALKQREEDGNRETEREPLRGKPLPVVELPVLLPVLNHKSFRIAPQLQEHPEREVVEREPDSPDAQRVVAELVLRVHRNVPELRESLQSEGQQQIAMVTRTGVLINGNTRCVLLRELHDNGKLTRSPVLRVAVLPHDFDNKDELELELILQQQKDLKDDYRLINELVMVRRLRDEGFTEAQIAKRRRLRKSAKGTGEDQVRQRLSILHMMESMRRLVDPPLRLTHFDHSRGKLEAWYELLQEWTELERQNSELAEAHLRRWLIAYFSGINSVHGLRWAKSTWVEDHVFTALEEDQTIRSVLDAHEARVDEAQSSDNRPPAGLDLLGSEPTDGEQVNGQRLKALLNAVIFAKHPDEYSDSSLDSVSVAHAEFLERLHTVVKKALGVAKARAKTGNSLERPQASLEQARTALQACRDALDEVGADPRFASRRAVVAELGREVSELSRSVARRLERTDAS